MTELNERKPRDASRRRAEPEMSLHDGRGRTRVEREDRYERAEHGAARRYEYAHNDRDAGDAEALERRAPARGYDDARRSDRRYDECRRQSARRRSAAKRRRGCMGILLAAILIAALLFVGAHVAGDLINRLLPKVREEYCPVKYEEFIRTHAAQNGLEPAHVAAVILTESSYNPQAVSNVGARGLMQLMPETAEWIAGKLGEEISEEQLFDPETNIRFGCYYLGFLMERYDGDMTCVTAAYHAGHGTVDRWLKNEEYSADGETLAVIASDVTNTYVSRVLRRYEKYTEIYAEEP